MFFMSTLDEPCVVLGWSRDCSSLPSGSLFGAPSQIFAILRTMLLLLHCRLRLKHLGEDGARGSRGGGTERLAIFGASICMESLIRKYASSYILPKSTESDLVGFAKDHSGRAACQQQSSIRKAIFQTFVAHRAWHLRLCERSVQWVYGVARSVEYMC